MSLCGTIQYLPPEMALGNYYNETADWWSFGIIIYEMICGKLPFDHDERSIIVKDIVSKELKFKKIFSEEAQDLISKLLVKDPKSRLGHDGVGDIMNHEFFKDVDWEELTATKLNEVSLLKLQKGIPNTDMGIHPIALSLVIKGQKIEIFQISHLLNLLCQ
eukprot:CAMPEP_0205812060 /NCGR_PEP_ID=MMETSP0205-20121125/16389_1 /ASSEMBLY_ACC=CAM_ASM_000278 /TAXON_ID=36767 /ORGANISM="Euplotes focardii, Strain TN1" /LENGTH=160 /DNA_ID=CAMNT_0053092111 /DNA_START=541 /DNA_END=1021 /DNA_ORIENTATION=-